jgi:hypothetical protein
LTLAACYRGVSSKNGLGITIYEDDKLFLVFSIVVSGAFSSKNKSSRPKSAP